MSKFSTGEASEVILPSAEEARIRNAEKAGPSRSVLIAEDDPISRHILESWFRRWGCQVTAVDNGLAAWEILQQANAPQMAVLDWMMPGVDGIELCRKSACAKSHTATSF